MIGGFGFVFLEPGNPGVRWVNLLASLLGTILSLQFCVRGGNGGICI